MSVLRRHSHIECFVYRLTKLLSLFGGQCERWLENEQTSKTPDQVTIFTQQLVCCCGTSIVACSQRQCQACTTDKSSCAKLCTFLKLGFEHRPCLPYVFEHSALCQFVKNRARRGTVEHGVTRSAA